MLLALSILAVNTTALAGGSIVQNALVGAAIGGLLGLFSSGANAAVQSPEEEEQS